MQILISDDDPVSRRLLRLKLCSWGYEVVACADGQAALTQLTRPDGPPLAILDWMMPGPDGPEVCRQVRQAQGGSRTPKYLMLLTAKTNRLEVVEGLQAGADDYITKPFYAGELRARVGVGARFVQLQAALAARVDELQTALAQVTQLQGLLPICAWCKKVRDDDNYWGQVETYIADRSDLRFSHGICPGCYETVNKEFNAEAASAVEEIATAAKVWHPPAVTDREHSGPSAETRHD